MRRQFLDLLADIGFLGSGLTDRQDRKGRNRNAREMREALYRYSSHAGDLELLRAVLAAGMYPNVVLVQQKKNRAMFRTWEDGKVDLHPASVNAKEKYFPSAWLVYNDKVKSSGIFVRASTMVSDYALLLFGGKIETYGAASVSMLFDYVQFTAPRGIIALVLELRLQLDRLLHEKVESPDMDLIAEGAPAVTAALALLHDDRPSARSGGGGFGGGGGGGGGSFCGGGGSFSSGGGLGAGRPPVPAPPPGPVPGRAQGFRGRGNGPPGGGGGGSGPASGLAGLASLSGGEPNAPGRPPQSRGGGFGRGRGNGGGGGFGGDYW